ncbi:MAG TPA: CAP domain-containing protein [Mycobacteriales bacterium]|nr:CAP domain-containing protein [Mycobacteriales bacterium]
MRRTIGSLVATLLALGAAFGLAPAHAATWTSSSYASRLVQLVNQARQQHGLPALTVTSGTSQVAAAWTAHLDSAQTLSHNPDLAHQLETHGSPDWTTYGENVGDGPANDPDALFNAYMNSTEHRDNILNGAFRYTGVAVVLDGSTAWNTFDFVDTYHSTTKTQTTSVKPKPAVTSSPRPAAVATSKPAPVPTAATTRASSAAAAPSHRRVVRAKRVSRALPHTGTRPLADPTPDLGLLLSSQDQHTAVLAASVRPLPVPLPRSSQLSIALAGLLLGFVGARWWQVARAA